MGGDLRGTTPKGLVSGALAGGAGQGSQHTAARFKHLLARPGAVQSRSRHGNRYDNTRAESFWDRFKTGLLAGGSFPGLAEARLEVTPYLAHYNAERQHPVRGYQSLNRFETHIPTTSQLCPA